MVSVNIADYESFDKALRAFRMKVRKAQIMEITNRKSQYTSPSERRHRMRHKRRA
jgi:ribosomal protein S21